jgi:hypothetical protein
MRDRPGKQTGSCCVYEQGRRQESQSQVHLPNKCVYAKQLQDPGDSLVNNTDTPPAVMDLIV